MSIIVYSCNIISGSPQYKYSKDWKKKGLYTMYPGLPAMTDEVHFLL